MNYRTKRSLLNLRSCVSWFVNCACSWWEEDASFSSTQFISWLGRCQEWLRSECSGGRWRADGARRWWCWWLELLGGWGEGFWVWWSGGRWWCEGWDWIMKFVWSKVIWQNITKICSEVVFDQRLWRNGFVRFVLFDTFFVHRRLLLFTGNPPWAAADEVKLRLRSS